MTTQKNSPQSRVPAKWYRTTDPVANKDFEKMLRNDGVVLGRLKEIIEEWLLEGENITEADFDSPSWANKQAFRLGNKRGLNKVRDLILFLDGE